MSALLRPCLLALALGACAPAPLPSPVPEPGPLPEDAGTPADGGSDAGSAAPISSRGSGGLPCVRMGSVSSGGVTYPYCVAEVAGVELKIIEPAEASPPGPLRLALYLHGDGARAYAGDTAPRMQAPWAHAHRTLYVSALAPNRCAWWTRPSLTACTDDAPASERDLEGANAAALVKVLEELRAGWDILEPGPTTPLLLGGSSGGSVFLTASFLPRYGHRYPALYALSCGGEAPWSGALAGDAAGTAWRAGARLNYTYGTQDQYLADIEGSVAWFRARAFGLDETRLPDTAHCAFDHIARVRDVWAGTVTAAP